MLEVNFFVRQLNVLFNNIFSSELLGKILSDDTALKEYKIDEKNFVVVMVTKVSFVFPLYRSHCTVMHVNHQAVAMSTVDKVYAFL